MKPTKSILILLSLFLISNCGEKVREEITERYDNGSKKLLVRYKGEGVDEIVVERITYSDNGDTLILEKPLEKMTMVREYYENGQIWKEGNYKDGKRDGKWTFYDKDGSLIGGGIYQYGFKWSGFFINYYSNGQIWTEGNYKEGKEDGKWTIYDGNGQIWKEGNYKDGKRDGKWTFYNKDGSIKEVKEF